MNNDAIERDEALEATVRQERPVDPDKICQFNITCREGLKRAVMKAGSEHHMSAAKYAAILLANALGDPALYSPPEKCAAAPKRGDGMTDQEYARMESVHKCQIAELEVRHKKELESLRAENAALSKIADTYETAVSALREKLFFAMRLAETLDSDGAEYYKALFDVCGISKEYQQWKDERK